VALIAVILALTFGQARAESGKILVLGDSLTAGYGLPEWQAFPAQLEDHLRAQGYDWSVINASISGDTTAGGLARFDWTVGDISRGNGPDLVILELGANDGLRGLPVVEMERNLDAIIAKLTEAGIGVLLAGMYAPPNYGEEYSAEFRAAFVRLAAAYDIPFYPFFLDGVAAKPALNQADGMHPTAQGVAEIVRRIAPYVVSLIGTRRTQAE